MLPVHLSILIGAIGAGAAAVPLIAGKEPKFPWLKWAGIICGGLALVLAGVLAVVISLRDA